MVEADSTHLGTGQGPFDCEEPGASPCLWMDTAAEGLFCCPHHTEKIANLSCPWMHKLKGPDCPQPDKRRLDMKQGRGVGVF